MSRIGIQPIKIEDGVTVSINGTKFSAKGPLGEMLVDVHPKIKVEVKDTEILVTRKDEEKLSKSLHGTFRMILANAVYGVKTGFTKKLELVGVGYRVKKVGNTIELSVGYTHPVIVKIPDALQVDVPDEVTILIKGYDRQMVGQFAANTRAIRKPEPYKGKGIKFDYEIVKRKSAKSATTKK